MNEWNEFQLQIEDPGRKTRIHYSFLVDYSVPKIKSKDHHL